MKKQFTELIGACCLSVFLLLISTTGAFSQYCTSEASNTTDEWLSNVDFAGISNSSGSTGYSDFTNISGTVVPGVTYQFSGTISQTGTFDELITVFIDWDQSFTFEASERYEMGTCDSDGCVLTGDIDVPATATSGETRMRVIQKYSSAPETACGPFTWGEVEDYSLTVEIGECTPPDFDFEVVNNCDNDTYNVEATINSLGTSSFITMHLSRSDAASISNVTVVPPLVGQTITIASGIPFGVSVNDSIVGGNPICTLIRNFEEEICPATNDEICEATEMMCGDTLTDQPFVGATQSIDDDCFGSGVADVWYTFTSDGSEKYIISETSTNDVVVSVYSGSDCGDTTLVMECDDFPESFTATEAGTYFMRVRPYSDDQFHTMVLECIPFDCPGLLADVGTPCDDGDPGTYEDVLQEDCSCAGFVPVPGQICEVPIVISSLPFADTDNTDMFFDDYSSSDVPPLAEGAITSGSSGTYYLNGDDVVYSYTPSGIESLNISVTDVGGYASVFVFAGCPFASTLAYSNTGFSEDDLAVNGLVVEAGITYYIVISTWAPPQSTPYTLDIESVAFDCPTLGLNFGSPCDDGDPNTTSDVINENCECEGIPIPDNNEACDATELVCNQTLEDQNMIGATVTVEDDCTNPENGDIWFKFTSQIGQAYSVDLDGDGPSSSSLTSSLFMADDCGNLINLLECNTFSSGYIFTVADTVATYYIKVRPYSSAETVDVTLQCAAAPANGDCSTAEAISCFETYTGSTLGAPTYSEDQPFCGPSSPSNTNGGVWYSYTPDTDIEATFDLSGSSYDTKLFLYDGTCDSLSCIDGDDDGGESTQSLIEASLTAGTTYYLFVSGFSNNRGDYVLNISCMDEACSPSITNMVAVNAAGDSLDCVSADGEYYVEVTIDGGGDTGYYLSVNDSTPVALAPNGSAIVGPVNGVDVANISVVGSTNQSCSTTAEFEPSNYCPPFNDEACDAPAIACGDTLELNFYGATQSIDDDCSGSSDNDVWVKFVSDGSQVYTIAEGGGDFFDGVVQLFESDDCNALTEVGACDDSPESFDVFDAGTYYFRIRPYSTSGEDDEATVTLTCTPFDCPELGGNIGVACDDGDPNTVNDIVTEDCECIGVPAIANDEACNATLIACGDTLTQSFVGASESIDDDCGGSSSADVWIKFVSDGSQVYTIAEGGGDSFDGVVQLFESDDCNALTEVGACDDSPEEFEVFDAGTYYFRIRPYSTFGEDDEATISLTCTEFECPDLNLNIGSPCDDGNPNTVYDEVNEDCECIGIPMVPNDEPCIATELLCGDTIVQTTAGATQTLDPVTCGIFTASQAYDVWFSFTADGTSDYTVSNISTDDLVIEAFSSNGCSDLTASIGCGDIPEEIELGVLAAGEYYVRAYAYSDFSPPYDVEMVLECENNSTASIAGTVDWNSDCGDRDGTVTLYEPDTDTEVASYAVTVAADGSFSIPEVEIGTFDVIVNVDGYLAKGIADVELVAGSNSLDMGDIVNGDINNDGATNLSDVSIVNASFGSVSGDGNYSADADLNCDGSVNLTDISIVNAGFNQIGDSAPLNQ